MIASLLLAGYIAAAFYLYYHHRRLWTTIIRGMKELTPFPEKWIAVSVYILMLMLPVLAVLEKTKKLLAYAGIPSLKMDSEAADDAKYFIATYFPELDEDLDSASIVLEKEDVASFLEQIASLFDSGFGEQEQLRIRNMLVRLEDYEEGKIIFQVSFQGRSVKMILRAVIESNDEYELTFYTQEKLADSIDQAMEVFVSAET